MFTVGPAEGTSEGGKEMFKLEASLSIEIIIMNLIKHLSHFKEFF
jgi:hypothetical protein